eukprot:GHVH01015102.1.p1 GENE.GHVH01015102.1~~GHVH01015102.1.p1  ORF type:complete len:413 (+),score=39.01 GHVH01015102.1:740-1978(+)
MEGNRPLNSSRGGRATRIKLTDNQENSAPNSCPLFVNLAEVPLKSLHRDLYLDVKASHGSDEDSPSFGLGIDTEALAADTSTLQHPHATSQSSYSAKNNLTEFSIQLNSDDSSLSFGSRLPSHRSRSTRSEYLVPIRSMSATHLLSRSESTASRTRSGDLIAESTTADEAVWAQTYCGGNVKKFQKKARKAHSGHSRTKIWIPFHLCRMVEPPITDEDVGDLAGRVVVDRYELVHVVGSGSSSTVYSAIDRRYKKNVALKIGSDSKESLDQLVYELQMIHLIDQSDVTSSHHTRVIDSFYWRSRMVIVMPLYGMDLYQRLLRSETLGSKDMFTRLATQILSCLCELHNCGIIHSDIKPENIVEGFHRAEKCNYYLIDFGMARLTSDIVSYYIQTRSYRAPELLLQLPYDTKV